MTYTVLAGT